MMSIVQLRFLQQKRARRSESDRTDSSSRTVSSAIFKICICTGPMRRTIFRLWGELLRRSAEMECQFADVKVLDCFTSLEVMRARYTTFRFPVHAHAEYMLGVVCRG